MKMFIAVLAMGALGFGDSSSSSSSHLARDRRLHDAGKHGKQLWSADIGGPASGAPLLNDDQTLLIVSSESTVKALDALDGSETWTADFSDDYVGEPLLSEDGALIFTKSLGCVRATSTGNNRSSSAAAAGNFTAGSTVWQWKPSNGAAQLQANPTLQKGRLYVPRMDGVVSVLNAQDGSELYAFEAHGFGTRQEFAYSVAVSDRNGLMFAHSQSGYLYCVHTTTKPTHQVGDTAWTFGGLDYDNGGGNLVIDDVAGTLFAFFGGFGGELHALRIQEHEPKVIWKRTMDHPLSMLTLGPSSTTTLYAGFGNGSPGASENGVVAVNTTLGEKLWEFDTADYVSSRATVDAVGGTETVFVGTNGGWLYGVDGIKGGSPQPREVFQFFADRAVREPVFDRFGHVAFVGTVDGKVFAVYNLPESEHE